MPSKIRFKVSHRMLKPRKPTAAQHDEAYRKIGCVDGVKGDKARVAPPKKPKR